MSSRNTVVRSLHDLGAAAWFGGSLMGAVGVNGAAAAVRNPADRAGVAAAGWAKWAPVSAAAVGAHLVGGAAILRANRGRAKHQSGVTSNTVSGATEPAPSTPDDVARAQQQLRYLQWTVPVLTGAIIVLGAQQGEQQRPREILAGLGNTLARRVTD